MNTRRTFFTRAAAFLGIGVAAKAQTSASATLPYTATSDDAVWESLAATAKRDAEQKLMELVKAITESPEATKILKAALRHGHLVSGPAAEPSDGVTDKVTRW